MNIPIDISGKNFKLTSALKTYVNLRINKILKLSSLKIKEIKVELDVDKNRKSGNTNRVEISAQLSGKTIKAGQKAKYMREAIDLCLPKILRQLKKYKDKKLKAKNPGQKTIRQLK